GLGIDLHNDGVTANDPGDADSGENMFQNFPSLTAATVCGGTTTIEGILDSTPSTQFRLEFFSNTGSDSSGYGEGQTFLGFKDVTTSSGGTVSFSSGFSVMSPGNNFISATATDPSNNTSEFSMAISPLIVTTGSASSISSGSATLNGALDCMGTADSVDLWFEYGVISGSYPYSTSPIAMFSPGTFSQVIGNLEPETTYYYIAMANGDTTDTLSCGSEKEFTTSIEGKTVDIYVTLQGVNRPVEGWAISLDVCFCPANSGTETLLNPGTESSCFSGTTTYVAPTVESGTRALLTVGPVNPGTYDITADSSTTLLNVKRNVGIW
ncbi:MAG: hypothetical protein R6U37_06065, partial [Dehalococcoidia bacterium]